MTRRTLTAVIIYLALSAPAHAMLTLHPGWKKFWLEIRDAQLATQIAQDAGGVLAWAYPAQMLVYVPSETALRARADASHVIVDPVQWKDQVQLSWPIDPAVDTPPNGVPADLVLDSYGSNAAAVYVVQFVGPITDNSWLAALQATGVRAHGFLPVNSYIIVGTPTQIGLARSLPFVQYLAILQPYQKLYWPNVDFTSPIRTNVTIELAESDPSVVDEISAYAERLTGRAPDLMAVMKIQDLPRLARNRLVLVTELGGYAPPLLFAVHPRVAGAGDVVTISGEGFQNAARVTFNGIPSPVVRFLDSYHVTAEVPHGLQSGPADMIVAGDTSQILPAAEADAFTVGAPTTPRKFLKGDLFASDGVLFPFFEGQSPQLRWLGSDRFLKMTRQESEGNFIDPSGRLNTIGYDRVTLYDSQLNAIGSGPQFAAGARAVVFDKDGDAIVVKNRKIERYSRAGALIGSIAVDAASDADLAADQCTLFYAGTRVGRVDVCTFAELPPFAAEGASSVKIAPDNSVLVGYTNGVRRYRSDGSLIGTFPIAAFGFTTCIAMSADGKSAFVANGNSIWQFDLATNTLSAPIGSASPRSNVVHLTVYGGWTPALGFVTYPAEAPPAPVPMLEPGLLILLALALAVSAAVRLRQST